MLRERLKAKILGNISILSLSLLLGLVAEKATEQRGKKEKLLLCKAFSDCASWQLVQYRQRKLIVSQAYQWAR